MGPLSSSAAKSRCRPGSDLASPAAPRDTPSAPRAWRAIGTWSAVREGRRSVARLTWAATSPRQRVRDSRRSTTGRASYATALIPPRVDSVRVPELSENPRHPCPTRPKWGRAKPVRTLGLRWAGLAWGAPAGGLLISRLKVRFLHGSPLDRGGGNAAPIRLFRARAHKQFSGSGLAMLAPPAQRRALRPASATEWNGSAAIGLRPTARGGRSALGWSDRGPAMNSGQAHPDGGHPESGLARTTRPLLG